MADLLSGQKVQNFLVQVAIYRCLLDIAAGMDYLHSLGVLHGECHSLGGNIVSMVFSRVS